MHQPASGVRPIPRASDGTYSLPSGTLVNTGDTILVGQHNPFAQDVAQAITSSLSRDGNGGMRAPLDMGSNRITGLSPGVGDTDAATVGQIGNSITVPIGASLDWWGTSPPSGFLLCYGQAISRTDYAELFGVLGTTFGSGDGATTFNLPDCRGRVTAGKDNMGGTTAGRLTQVASGVTGTTLGATGGAQTHVLTTAQIPSHTHTGTTNDANTTGLQSPAPVNYFGSDAIYQPDTETHNHTFTTNATGGDQAHNNVQPTIISNKIIRVL